ncbi:hypothetical protein RJ035_006747 [Blastomyces gilchristii]
MAYRIRKKRLLINKKENKLEEMDITGRTPLSWAAEWGRLDVVELLLDRGAELDRMDWNGRSALSWVAEGGSLTVIQLLIKRGADVNLRDVEGTGSLGWAHWTGRGENYNLVKKLLWNHGVRDPDVVLSSNKVQD